MDQVLLVLDATFFNATSLCLVTLGVLVSIRFTGYPDLTIDGSYTLGAALYAVLLAGDLPVALAILSAMIGGALCGLATGLLNQVFRIGKLVAGIVVMLITILSLPYIIGSNTIGLIGVENFFTTVETFDSILTTLLVPHLNHQLHLMSTTLLLGCLGLLALLLQQLMRSSLGCTLRYVGGALEPYFVSSKTQTTLILFGLMLGNALAALGGALAAERTGGFSQGMGLGLLLVGFGALVFGESVVRAWYKISHLHVGQYITASFIGALLYTTIVQMLLFAGPGFVDVRLLGLVTLVVVLAVLSRKQETYRDLF